MTRFRQYEMTAGQWAAQNIVLLGGEVGWESGNPPKAKKGDGVTPWNDLPYAVQPAAPIDSPTFIGDPKAPTPVVSDNDTSIATTAFVKAAIAALIGGSPALLDTLDELAQALGDDPNFAATMTTALAGKAPLASPVFTGNPTGPTPLTSDNDTSLATTAFVKAVLAAYAPLASPTFTGDPKAPTPVSTDNDTSIATTAFVKAAIAAYAINEGVSVSSTSADYTGTVVLRRIGGTVFASGGFSRPSGFSGSYHAVGDVPLGYRPINNVVPPASPWQGSSSTFQYGVAATGSITIRESAANAGQMSLSESWPTSDPAP